MILRKQWTVGTSCNWSKMVKFYTQLHRERPEVKRDLNITFFIDHEYTLRNNILTKLLSCYDFRQIPQYKMASTCFFCVRTHLVVMEIFASTQAVIERDDQVARSQSFPGSVRVRTSATWWAGRWVWTDMVRARPPDRILKREKILALAKVTFTKGRGFFCFVQEAVSATIGAVFLRVEDVADKLLKSVIAVFNNMRTVKFKPQPTG